MVKPATDLSKYKICTLGSHSALQILKGAHDEGFQTIAICEKRHVRVYESFKVADRIIAVDSLSELKRLDKQLAAEGAIMIPHGSLPNALTDDEIRTLKMNHFGNKQMLPVEADRRKQREWLEKSGLTLPKIYEKPEDINGPTITKFHGAGAGKGYFLAHTPKQFKDKIAEHTKVARQGDRGYIIQEYIVGAPVYTHYFYSQLSGELEIMGFDKRYESNVDSIGRISARDQIDLNIESSYHIIGNWGIVVRESLLSQLFEMGEAVIKESQKIDGVGLFGPFCLEMVITPDLEFFVFEISARIVAGTNPFVNGSPYTDLRYNEPMSTGRRIAREIKTAIKTGQTEKIFK